MRRRPRVCRHQAEERGDRAETASLAASSSAAYNIVRSVSRNQESDYKTQLAINPKPHASGCCFMTALPQKPKSHQLQLVDGSDPTYKSNHQLASLIPPTAVGGYFRSSLTAETLELGGI